MKKSFFFPFFLAGAVGLVTLGIFGISQAQTATTATTPQGISLEVSASAATRKNVSRLGLNLGPWTSWGAGQFGKNLIQNPGFEGTINQIVVFVNQSDATSFCDDVNQVYPNGLWNGASWLVRTGPSAGAKGTVTTSVGKGAKGFPQYFADSVPALNVGDVIILTKITKGNLADFWWTSSTDAPKMSFDTSTYRPGSSGVQSLKMSPTKAGDTAEMDYGIDSITSRSGKLINLSGSWIFSIWAKSDGAGTLNVIFQRYGSSLFLNQTITPTGEWQEYQFQFNIADTGPSNGVGLKITASNGTVWVDDITLAPIQTQNMTAFRQETIDAINNIRPCILRSAPDLSNTFSNRSSTDPYGRKYSTERANGEQLGHPDYDFSIDEFLTLCQKVNASPWIIMPVTWSDEEYTLFGQYLALKAGLDKFPQVVVEFGNENWNMGFRPLAFCSSYTTQHGIVATRAFDLIKTAAQGAANIKTAVNGQAAWPTLSYQYYDSAPTADIYTPASYFYDEFDTGTTNDAILSGLFAPDPNLSLQASAIQQRGKQAAIYEYNLNTSGGTAKDAERIPILAGAIGGVALAKRTIELINMGYDPALVYCLSQYDINSTNGFAKIFGITVSLGAPTVYRPTGLVVTMLNRVIAGDLYKISATGTPNATTDNLTMAAFRASDMWTAALTSQNNSPQTINLQFPDDGHPLPQTYMTLQFNTMFDTNETSPMVKIVSNNLSVNGRVATFTIPAYGCVVLGESKDSLKVYAPAASTNTTAPASNASPSTTTPATTIPTTVAPAQATTPSSTPPQQPAPAAAPVQSAPTMPIPAPTPAPTSTPVEPTPAPTPAPASTPVEAPTQPAAPTEAPATTPAPAPMVTPPSTPVPASAPIQPTPEPTPAPASTPVEAPTQPAAPTEAPATTPAPAPTVTPPPTDAGATPSAAPAETTNPTPSTNARGKQQQTKHSIEKLKQKVQQLQQRQAEIIKQLNQAVQELKNKERQGRPANQHN